MPAAMTITPVMTARRAARVTARASSPADNGTMAAAMSGTSDESGPRTRIRDGPIAAYVSNGTIEAYRPTMGGRPDASA